MILKKDMKIYIKNKIININNLNDCFKIHSLHYKDIDFMVGYSIHN